MFKTPLPTLSDFKCRDEVSLNLMSIEGKAIINAVHTATRFSTAVFLEYHNENYGRAVEEIYLPFFETRCTLYTGFPNRIRTDAGSVFT